MAVHRSAASSRATRRQVGVEPDLPLRGSENIQGNILAGFNKDHQTFLFVQFAAPAGGRAWLHELAPRVATTRQVAEFNERFSLARHNRGGDDPEDLKGVWLNVSLTHRGLCTLAPARKAELASFIPFVAGPARRAACLRDQGPSAPTRWVFGGAGQQRIDAILLVAADDPDDLRVELDRQWAAIGRHRLAVVFEQRGATLPAERRGHEHFGFKDGISQPSVRGFDPAQIQADRQGDKGRSSATMIAAGEFILGHGRQDDSKPPVPTWMFDGSFQVVRRLRQDVPGWWSQVVARSRQLPAGHPMKDDADVLAANLVGRWRSGTPLALAPERDNHASRDRRHNNDFDYEDDPRGHKTPRFAHIRKVYPRNDDRFRDADRRIIRRGIPFGRHFDPAAGRGHGVDAERGLIFNAYMANIEEQFEFLQQKWANPPEFPGNVFGDDRTDGPDPIIGEDRAPCALCRDGVPDEHLDFRRFVQTTGAVYAFTPSVGTLRRLGRGEL